MGIWLGSSECCRTPGFLNCVSQNVLNGAQRLNVLNDLNVSILAQRLNVLNDLKGR